MREGWWWRLLALAAVVGIAVLVVRIVEDGSTSNAEAEEAIEALPYRVDVHEGEHGVLLGTIWDRAGHPVRFAVARSYEAEGVPAWLRHLDPNVTGGGGFILWGDGEGPQPGEIGPGGREGGKLELAIEEALCRKATGKACPI
jgi:hypothetical protein